MASLQSVNLDFIWADDIEDQCEVGSSPVVPAEVWDDWRMEQGTYAAGESRFWTLPTSRQAYFKADAARNIELARQAIIRYSKSQFSMTLDKAKLLLRLASTRALPLSNCELDLSADEEVDRIYSNTLYLLIPYLADFKTEENLQLLIILRDAFFEEQPSDGVSLEDGWRLDLACERLFILGSPSIDFTTNLFNQFFSPLVSLDEKLLLLKRVFPLLIHGGRCRFFALEVFATLCHKGMHPNLVDTVMEIVQCVNDEKAFTVLYPVFYSYARTFKLPIIYQREEDDPAYDTFEGPAGARSELDEARLHASADCCNIRPIDAENTSTTFNALVDYYDRMRYAVHSCDEGDKCIDAKERLRWDIKGKQPYKCFVCLKPAKTACSRCAVIRFCSTTCQAEAWTADIGHKHFCPIIRNARLGQLKYNDYT